MQFWTFAFEAVTLRMMDKNLLPAANVAKSAHQTVSGERSIVSLWSWVSLSSKLRLFMNSLPCDFFFTFPLFDKVTTEENNLRKNNLRHTSYISKYFPLKCLKCYLHGLYVKHTKLIMLMSFFNNQRLAVVLSATIPKLLMCASLWLTLNTQVKRDWWSTSHRCAPPGWLDKWISSLTHFLYASLTNMNIYIDTRSAAVPIICVFMFSSTCWEQFTSIYPVSQDQDDESHSDCKIFVSFWSCVTQLWTFSTQLRCKVTLFSLLHYNL